ncbi:MAG TPA: glycosyltransferase family 2 protein, partial [Terriglobales bacterium]|nr:glycosyltransferase family 2 protein [Terriglobales bacterium]
VLEGSVATLVETLRRDPTTVAAVGIYASRCGVSGLVSDYKNLWIRHSYLRGARQIDWMTTACCAVRHSALAAIGYFDPSKSAAAATDDIDVGRRLAAAGGRIELVPTAEVQHRKRYSLSSFCRNEWTRSRAWTQLAWQQLGVRGIARRQSFNNIPLSFVSAMAAQGIALIGLLAGLAGARSGWWLFAGGLAAILVLHRRWLGFLVAERGGRFAAATVPLLCLDLICCGLGLVVGTFESAWRAPLPEPGRPYSGTAGDS